MDNNVYSVKQIQNLFQSVGYEQCFS